MRTKHLLTAMVLPALFAACTNEEIDVVKSTASLNERAIVENVTFNFSDQAASRLTYNGKYVWQAGDQIGACLMDEIVQPTYWDFTADWKTRFELVDYIQTNYKFSRNADGEWATEAKMCEGNYFLAFPYDANQGIRAAYRFSCDDQTLENTTTAALMDAFAKNNSFVGYAQVKQGANESVAVDMVPVFESTGFTLKNTGTNSYTIEKIVLHGDKVYSEAVIDPTNSNYRWFDANQKDVLVYSLNRGTSGRIDVAIEGGNVVAPQASINVIVMSGTAALAADADAYLEIHTDKGLIRGINLNEKQTADNGALGNGATVNVLTDKALAALGKGDKVNVTFDDTSIDIPNEMDIYSSDELYNLIKWNAAVKNVDVTANLQAPVALTAEMYNILKNSGAYGDGKSTLTITGPYAVTINANVPQDGIDLVTFANSKIFIAGTQTITTGTAPYTRELNVPVEVLEGATFNVQANVNNTVENFGTVAAKKVNGTITKLINRAAATVDANLSTALYNLGTVTNNATLNATGENYGTLENKGTLTGALVNKAYLSQYLTETKMYNPTINNYGKILAVENNNVIVMKDKEARINEANGACEIDNTIQSDYIASGVKNIVFVKVADMTATELHEIVLNADATKVYVSGTLTIDPATAGGEVKVTKVTAIVAEGDLTIAGKGKVWFNANPSFTVNANTETVVENGSTLSIGSGALTVKANGLLTIKNNGKVICGSYSGNIENYGDLN